MPADRVLRTHTPEYASALAAADAGRDWEPADDDDLYLLIFTSGSTGFPKAVRCTQGRLAAPACTWRASRRSRPGKVVYAPLPFFHTSALFTGLASALHAGAAIGSRAKFSASQTMPDIRRMGAVMLTYTGKVLNYILAVPPSPDDADNPLELAIGNEASESDIREFAARFDCQVRDSYGSTEGMIIIRRDATMPRGSIGRGDDTIRGVRSRHRGGAPAGRVRRAGSARERRHRRRRDRQHRSRRRLRGLLPQRGGARVEGARRRLLLG